MVLLIVPLPSIRMPSPWFNVMTFPSPCGALPTVQSPPMVLYFAPSVISTPSPGKRIICSPLIVLPSEVMRKQSAPPDRKRPSMMTPAFEPSMVIEPCVISGRTP